MIRARAGAGADVADQHGAGLTKPYGERLRGCNPRNMNPEKAQGLSPELQAALEPLLGEIESVLPALPAFQQIVLVAACGQSIRAA